MADLELPIVHLSDAVRAHTWSLRNAQGTLVTVNLDTGEIIFSEHYTPGEAARVFWEAIGRRGRKEQRK